MTEKSPLERNTKGKNEKHGLREPPRDNSYSLREKYSLEDQAAEIEAEAHGGRGDRSQMGEAGRFGVSVFKNTLQIRIWGCIPGTRIYSALFKFDI